MHNDCYFKDTCRLCKSRVKLALELTPTPPANELVRREDLGKEQDVFPLELWTCSTCGHVQLGHVVSPQRLFGRGSYPYRSGTSPVFRDHLQRYAIDLVQRYGRPKRVLEIGSNDGTFLTHFVQMGIDVVGIEPDAEAAQEAIEKGVYTINDYFDRKQLTEDIQVADLIVANHVFAHINDLSDVAAGIKQLLPDHGHFVFEVGYLPDVIKNNLFDTIYHEHVSYHTLGPLVRFFESFSMVLYDAERVATQGGAIRCYVQPNRARCVVHERLAKLLAYEKENGFSPSIINITIGFWGQSIHEQCNRISKTLHEYKQNGLHIAGYGAPAKCVTMMHHMDFGSDVLDFIVDDNPKKHGLFTPGQNVEILPVSALYERKPDIVVVLAWNFADSIIAAHPEFNFLVPLPELKMVQR